MLLDLLVQFHNQYHFQTGTNSTHDQQGDTDRDFVEDLAAVSTSLDVVDDELESSMS